MNITQETLTIDKFTTGLVDQSIISKVSYPADACIDAKNIIFYPRGTIAKRPGFDKLHTSAWKADGIVKIFPWQSVAGTKYNIVFSPSGAASADIAIAALTSGTVTYTSKPCTGATWSPEITTPISACSYAGSAVATYGGTIAPICFTGGSFCEVISAAPSGAKHVAGWNNFLFAGNFLSGSTRLGSRVQWCYPANASSWPVGYYADLDANDGDEITGMRVLADYIVIFKANKIFVGQWVGGVNLFQFTRISNAVGAISGNAIVERRGVLYFIARDGIYQFDGYSTPKEISQNIKNHILSINQAMAYKAQATVYEPHHQVWFSVPYGSSTICDRIYVYDYELNAWTKFHFGSSALGTLVLTSGLTLGDLGAAWSTYDLTIGDLYTNSSEVTVVGTYAGFIDRYGISSDDEGAAFEGYWISQWFDFGFPERNKRLMRATVLVEKQSGSYNMTCDLYSDWDDVTITNTFPIPLAGSTLVLERRLDFTLHIRAVQFKFSTNVISSPFTLHAIKVPYLMKGKTLIT